MRQDSGFSKSSQCAFAISDEHIFNGLLYLDNGAGWKFMLKFESTLVLKSGCNKNAQISALFYYIQIFIKDLFLFSDVKSKRKSKKRGMK